MKLVAVPLDIRPYNYQFLEDITSMDDNVCIKLPSKDYLGFKKRPAKLTEVDNFIFENIKDADALIISLDMLIYGGLLPSRMHNNSFKELENRLEILKKIKKINKGCKIYASNLITRTPKYNSSEEEPDYYKVSGKDIFYFGYFEDKKSRAGLTKEEEKEFDLIKERINKEHLDDFINRRNKNIDVTLKILEYVKNEIIDILIIPQDDASEFGFTAKDQKKVYFNIEKLDISDKVFLHPGTDESGCTLITRAYTDKVGKVNIYPYYITESFKNLIPNYEDRPFMYSLVSHAEACGINLVEAIEEADLVLGINGAPKLMQESFEISSGEIEESLRKDISYYRYRNFNVFCKKIDFFIKNGKEVSILDVAFSNGGETQLIKNLDKYNLLERIKGYSGWNTCCNSLGTILSSMVFSHFGNREEKIEEFKIKRVISDWAYQTEEMIHIQESELAKLDINFKELDKFEDYVMEIVKEKVSKRIKNTFVYSYKDKDIRIDKVHAPFKRMRGLEFYVKVL